MANKIHSIKIGQVKYPIYGEGLLLSDIEGVDYNSYVQHVLVTDKKTGNVKAGVSYLTIHGNDNTNHPELVMSGDINVKQDLYVNGNVDIGGTNEDVNIGEYASDINIGNEASHVNIGENASDVNIGWCASTLSIGREASNIYIGGDDSEVSIDAAITIKNGANLTLQSPSNAQTDPGDLVFAGYGGDELCRLYKDPHDSKMLMRFGESNPSYTMLHSGNSYINNENRTVTINNQSIVIPGEAGTVTIPTHYGLTLQSGAFTPVTYNPTGASATVNIPTSISHLTGGTIGNGTIFNPVTIKGKDDSSAIWLADGYNNEMGGFGFHMPSDTANPIVWYTTENGLSQKYLVHSGNISSYALPLSGGTLTDNVWCNGDQNCKGFFGKNIKFTGATGWAREILRLDVDNKTKFSIGGYGQYNPGASDNESNGYVYIGCNDYNGANLRLTTSSIQWGGYNLIHSGNIGNYKLSQLTNNNQTFIGRTDGIISNTDADNFTDSGAYLFQTGNGENNTNFPITGYGILNVFNSPYSNRTTNYVGQLLLGTYSIFYRTKVDTWSDWKQIALTSDIPTSLPASDVYAWAKAATKPSYTWSEITSRPTALSQFTDDVVAGKYLPLSGGTINSTAVQPLYLKNNQSSCGILFFNSTDNATLMYSGGSNWRVTDNGWSNAYYLLHSGNIGNYKAGDSAKLDGLSSSSFYVGTRGSIKSGDDLSVLAPGGYWLGATVNSTNPLPTDYASLSVLGNDYYSSQLCVKHDSTRAWIRGTYPTKKEVSNWHEVAFTDSNVASATKLQTPRTLWGQSFDGTANVDGAITIKNGANLTLQSPSDAQTDPGDIVFTGFGGDELCRLYKDPRDSKMLMRFGETGTSYTMLHSGNIGNYKSGDSAHLNGIGTGWWDGIPHVQSDGVMNIGKYIDFHDSSASTNDFDVRLQCISTNKNTVYLPSATGQLALTTDGAPFVFGTYTNNGGEQYPSYVTGGTTRWNMMRNSTTYYDKQLYDGYCDWMLMDNYTGFDVPYVTGIGVLKSDATRAFIMSGAKGTNNKWKIKELATKDAVVTTDTNQSIGGNKTFTGDVTANSITANKFIGSIRGNIIYDNGTDEGHFIGLGSNGVGVKGLLNYVYGNFPILFYTNGFERMRIGEYVGIGTTSPTEKLDVAGNVKASGDITAPKIVVKGSNHSATMEMNVSSLKIDKELMLTAGGTADICSGIACALKADRLQVKNLISENIILGSSNTGTQSNMSFNVQKYGSISNTAPASLTTLLTVNTTGNVGIGVANPSEKLDVNGNAKIGGDFVAAGKENHHVYVDDGSNQLGMYVHADAGGGSYTQLYTYIDGEGTDLTVGYDEVTINTSLRVFDDVHAYSFYQNSDERLKTFGDKFEVDFEKLAKLRKSYFTFNNTPDKTHIGVSAQEVQKICPEIVNTDKDGYLSVDYSKLSVVALTAVDELYKKNIELENRLAKIEAMLAKINIE